MCVIIYKPAGIEMPCEKDLKLCFETNRDGAGYMIPLNNKVIVRKGFMTFDDFKKDIRDFVKTNNIDPTNTPIVIHFRITTQGGVKQELCHPYPICDNYEQMRALASECDLALAHNGIISLCSEYSYGYTHHYDEKLKKYVISTRPIPNYNDTMTFIKDYASLIIDNDLYFARKLNKVKLIEKLIGSSKLAIMNKKGFVKLIGKFEKRNDVYYSNLNAFNTHGFYTMQELLEMGALDDDYR